MRPAPCAPAPPERPKCAHRPRAHQFRLAADADLGLIFPLCGVPLPPPPLRFRVRSHAFGTVRPRWLRAASGGSGSSSMGGSSFASRLFCMGVSPRKIFCFSFFGILKPPRRTNGPFALAVSSKPSAPSPGVSLGEPSGEYWGVGSVVARTSAAGFSLPVFRAGDASAGAGRGAGTVSAAVFRFRVGSGRSHATQVGTAFTRPNLVFVRVTTVSYLVSATSTASINRTQNLPRASIRSAPVLGRIFAASRSTSTRICSRISARRASSSSSTYASSSGLAPAKTRSRASLLAVSAM
mmetsp:Transcript_36871/g.85161  ORF Transcript_36871/g.85161 Transcript_36871/m.85161 type:complete len:295 (-) Transcript_36871:1250-2134(-)